MSRLFSRDGIHFRLPGPADSNALQDLRNDESTWIHLKDPKPVGPADQKAWFESIGWKSGKMYFVAYDDSNPFINRDEHSRSDGLRRPA